MDAFGARMTWRYLRCPATKIMHIDGPKCEPRAEAPYGISCRATSVRRPTKKQERTWNVRLARNMVVLSQSAPRVRHMCYEALRADVTVLLPANLTSALELWYT